jgi:anti-anti-sigma factor
MNDTEMAQHLSVKDGAADGVSTVRIKDAFLNYAMSDELKRSLKDLCRARIAAGTRAFAVDLTPVTMMDSCGLSVLISVKKFVEAEGGKMSVFALSPMIERLFTITKLDRVFDIHRDEAAALAALTKS